MKMSRGTGKTFAMVKALEPNSIVIVHNKQMEHYLRQMIFDIRGSEFAKTTKIFVLDKAILSNLIGSSARIVVDHWVHERDDMNKNERQVKRMLDELIRTRRPMR